MKNHRKGSKNWKFPVVDLRKFHSNTLFRAIFPEMKICQKYLFTSTSVFDGNTNILVGLFSRPKYSWNILKFHVQNGLSNSWKLALQSNQCFRWKHKYSCHANIQHAKIFPKKSKNRKFPPKNWKFDIFEILRDLELDFEIFHEHTRFPRFHLEIDSRVDFRPNFTRFPRFHLEIDHSKNRFQNWNKNFNSKSGFDNSVSHLKFSSSEQPVFWRDCGKLFSWILSNRWKTIEKGRKIENFLL